MQKYAIKICKNRHKNTTIICKICRSPSFTYFVFICIPHFANDRRPTPASAPQLERNIDPPSPAVDASGPAAWALRRALHCPRLSTSIYSDETWNPKQLLTLSQWIDFINQQRKTRFGVIAPSSAACIWFFDCWGRRSRSQPLALKMLINF